MDQPRKSTKDKQLQATLYLKEVSSRMKDIIFELNTLHKTFSDKDSSIRQKTNVLASLKNVIIPFLTDASEKMISSSNVVAPISGTSFVHNMNETKRKNESRIECNKNIRKRKSSPLKRIEHAIQFRDINITPDNSYIKPVKKSRRLKLITLPTIVQKLPPPNEGKEYSPDEVVSILSPYPEKSTNKYQLIKHILKK